MLDASEAPTLKNKLCYLASPYSSPDEGVREERYDAAQHAVATLVRNDYLVYSPIVSFHPVATNYNLPKDAAFWRKLNWGMIDACEWMAVLLIEGWIPSVGVQEEIGYAHSRDMQIFGLYPTDRAGLAFENIMQFWSGKSTRLGVESSGGSDRD